MQQGRSSTPFADTNRVWMDVFVRATEMVAGGAQLVATAAKMAALHTGGSRSCATETAPRHLEQRSTPHYHPVLVAEPTGAPFGP